MNAKSNDEIKDLEAVCARLLPYAVEWRGAIYASNVDGAGVVLGQENRDEIAVLDEFIGACAKSK